jgi:high-affinity nickel-transport protein
MPKSFAICAALIVGNIAVWCAALFVFRGHPALIGMALLAYVFGLRHAVDADHIAAIDNATRKLMQQGQRPFSVGLHFSLGHSTVVALACAVIALASTSMQAHLQRFAAAGGAIGTGISAAFLLFIALANIATLVSLYRALGNRGGDGADARLHARGFISLLLRPLMLLVSRPWQMYPVGFLFGLGFDTATEIGLLGLAASQAGQFASPWLIMIFPALFAAGMSLVDTLDGMLMIGAYGWALTNPERKLRYNFLVTLISVAVALALSAVQALNVIGSRFALTDVLNGHFGTVGLAIVAIFLACWGTSLVLGRHERWTKIVS